MNKKSLLFVIPMIAGALASCGKEPEEKHNCVLVPGTAATCTEDGILEHYHCDHCNKDFKDEAATQLLEDVVNHATGHEMSGPKGGEAATCTEDGTKVYYECAHEPGVLFKDAEGSETYANADELTIPMIPHNYTSLEVSGDFRKTYEAFEEFDTTNLVVSAICGECSHPYVLNEDEYIISYQTFGADSFKVGDTAIQIYASDLDLDVTVTGISVSKAQVEKPVASETTFVYDGSEKTLDLPESTLYTIEGATQTSAGEYVATVKLNDKENYAWKDGDSEDLSINFVISKAENAITGLASSYTTYCGVAPTLTGVSSTAGEVSIKYFSDSECTNEVALENLVAGEYVMRVISGNDNYESVSATATLTVEHNITHHDQIPATILEDGRIEYWGCDGCGLAYLDEECSEATDDVVIPAGGSTISESAICSNGIAYEKTTEVTAPQGFEYVNKLATLGSRIEDCKKYSQAIVSNYECLAFAVKCGDGSMYVEGAAHIVDDHSWIIAEIKTTAPFEYHCVFKTEDGTVIDEQDFEWDSPNTDTGYINDALNNVMFKAEVYSIEPSNEFYVTELKGIYKDAPVGDLLEESAINSNDIAYETKLLEAPKGFRNVNKVAVTGDRSDTKFYSTLNAESYELITFAIKADFAESGYLLLDGWAAYVEQSTWVIVEITPTGNYNYVVNFKLIDGTVKYTEEFEWKDAADTGYATGGVNNIMFKANTYADRATDSFYVTELRGIKRAKQIVGDVVDESAISANGITKEKIDAKPAAGFSSNYQITGVSPTADNMHGQFYSHVDLRGYSEVHFAAMTSGFWSVNSIGNIGQTDKWVYFSLTNNGDTTFNLVMTDENDTILFSQDNLPSFKADDPGAYANYSLSTILYGNSLEVTPMKGEGDLLVYASELRGTELPVPLIGEMIEESAICSNGIEYTLTSDEAPKGFEKVNKVAVTGDRSDSKYFAQTIVGNYGMLTFGMRCNGYLLLDGWASYVDNGSWVIVEAKCTGGHNFTVDFKDVDGNLIYNETFEYADLAGEGYVLDGLNNVMFKCATYASSQTDSFFVTELRGLAK